MPVDTTRFLQLDSPFAGDLAIRTFEGTEEIGRLFHYQLELISDSIDLSLEDLIGQTVTIKAELESGSAREFHGYVTDLRYTGTDERHSYYSATVRPWLWFLTRTSDCRIFQEMKVPDIIKEVFRDNGMMDFKDSLSGHYKDWVYCVQYRETDFNFVTRLMEQEGIYYYFEHKDGKHTLVMADDMTTHETFEGAGDIPYLTSRAGVRTEREDFIQFLQVAKSIQPEKYVINDFDFERPQIPLEKRLEYSSRGHAYPNVDAEMYDYPGEYIDEKKDADNYVKLRLEELQCQYERAQISGPCRLLAPGFLMKLSDHPRDDQNRELLVVSAAYQFQNADFTTGRNPAIPYECQAEVMCKEEPFRSPRITPKPIVQGCQTAEVVGPSSEEIYCDEYGRVKVQFHWDRYGTKDENSSCWIRVSQAWAGKEWGSMHIPRIGQEVIVSFLEGDPDQPLITGRVFNGDNMPIWGLPGSKTQSGIKSRSTPGGGPSNYNEVRMEDQKGSELLSIQAEKDEKILVKNDKNQDIGHDETNNVGNDRTETIGNDETRSVGHDESITIGNNRTDIVTMNEDRTVGKDRNRKVSGSETVLVVMTRDHTVGINESINVGGAQEITVGGMQTLSVVGKQEFSVGLSREVSVVGSQSEEFRSLSTETKKDWSVEVGGDFASKTKGKVNIEAGDELVLKCGQAKLILKKNGNITLSGLNIKQKAKAALDLQASGTVKVKGATVKDN